MVYTRSNALRGTGRKTGGTKRRTSQTSKVRYQRPNAYNQQKQILRNTRLVNKVARVQASQRVYTDWQKSETLPTPASGNWIVQPLTNFPGWTSVLRKSDIANRQVSTFVRNLQINFRYYLNNAPYCYISLFIVTMRKNSSGLDPFTSPPQPDLEYIENKGVQGSNIRLNPAVYKVHYAKYMTLLNNGVNLPIVPADTVGDPRTTWRKGQVNLPVKMKVVNPSVLVTGSTWGDLTYENLPYYQRYYLMAYITYGVVAPGGFLPGVSYDLMATCINSD